MVGGESIQDFSYNPLVFLQRGSFVDEDIVEIDNNLACKDHILEDIIHHLLESGRGVTKAKEHNRGLEQSTSSDKCGLPFIASLDPNIIVAPSYVKFGEPDG